MKEYQRVLTVRISEETYWSLEEIRGKRKRVFIRNCEQFRETAD